MESKSGNVLENTRSADWVRERVSRYTGIGAEVRESYFGGAMNNAKVVVNMPQGLGRYTPEDAVDGFNGVSGDRRAGYRPPAKFEWYLKNHIGSTMLVYGTSAYNDPLNSGYKGGVKAAYDYRAFGEQVDLTMPTDKVTENFTGKEKDDETELNYFGARYLDPMLGLWTSVDPARQFASPYLYAGNGVNPVNGVDDDGNVFVYAEGDNVTPGFVASFVSKLSPEARARYDQLDKSSNYYYLRKIDEVYQDPDFNDDMNSLGGVAFARSFKKDGKDVVGGEAEFANARYFLHEVLQHLFDFDNELKKNGGNAEAANKSYSDNRVEWEQRAEDFQDEENMPGVDLDEY